MANGKLFIIEAGDGSGKETQTRLLAQRLVREGHRIVPVTFPDYTADSSMLVRMYLRGACGRCECLGGVDLLCRRPLRLLSDEVGAGL